MERILVDLHLVVLADREERTLYLWRSSVERIAIDLHLVILADRDEADIILVAQFRGEDCSPPAPRQPRG